MGARAPPASTVPPAHLAIHHLTLLPSAPLPTPRADSRVPLAREPTCGMTFSGYAGEWVACARAANPLAPVVDAPTHLALAAAVDRQQAADAAATWQPQPQQQQAPLVTASL